MFVTSAPLGPWRHHATMRSTASGSPSKAASTRPSLRLRTHPNTPPDAAMRWQLSRKNTPCTRPSTSTRRRTCTGVDPTLTATMEVLSFRVILRPVDLERSLRFYGEALGLHVYREY